MTSSLKDEFLELLEKDKEFRYAVAGFLGLDEILRRLDRNEQELVKLREDMNRLREDTNAGFKRHDEEITKLREDFNKAFRLMNLRLNRVERMLEKLTLDIEEEGRIVIEHRLSEKGIRIKIGSLTLPELELNIYGVSNDICIIGEASVRASSRVIDELNKKLSILKSKYPERLRPKIIRVIYTSLALPDLIERAEKEGIWVLKATEDIVPPSI